MVRSGSWIFGAHICRSAIRYNYSAGYRGNDLGFRIVFKKGEKK